MFGLLGGLGLLLVGTSPAKASIDYSFVGASAGTYTYNVTFTPGTNEQLDTTGYVTLYDFVGLSSLAQVTGTALTAFPIATDTIQLLGVNGFGTAPPDSPTINNLTLNYKGATVTTTTNFGTIIISGGTLTPVSGAYSGTTTITLPSPPHPSGNVSSITVSGSAVPEPASIVMFSLGIGVLGVVRLRKRVFPA